jgi:hypothetical protein
LRGSDRRRGREEPPGDEILGDSPTSFTRNLDTDIPPSEEAMEAARAALLFTVTRARVRGDSMAKAAAECRPAWQVQAGVLPALDYSPDHYPLLKPAGGLLVPE